MPGYDPIVFQNPDFVLADGFLVATYYLEVAAATDLVKKAGDIAVGQTTGGWLELPRATRDVTERAVGRVLSVTEVPPYEDRRPIPENEPRRAVVRIAFPVENFGADLGALLVAVYGKVSLDGAIKLVDLELPPALVAKLPGPKHGIEGLRKKLEAPERPLTMSIFKPTLGLAPEALADMIAEQAAGGIDLVKDDEVLTDATVDATLKRIDLCRKAAKKARPDGAGVLHAVSLTGPADELVSRARRLSAEGAGALLFNTLAYGLPLMAAIAKDPGVTSPIMAHPALAGGMALEAQHGIAAHVLLGKLMRLAGADLVLFPSPYGSVGLRRESALKLSFALTRPLHGMKPAFPVPSAGITPSLVPQLLADYGHDVVVNAGGAVHGHPDGAKAGAQAFVAAVDATFKKVPLADAAANFAALKRAMEIWK